MIYGAAQTLSALPHNAAARQAIPLPLNAKVSALFHNQQWGPVVHALNEGEVKERILSTVIRVLFSGLPRTPPKKKFLLARGKWIIPKHSFVAWQLLSDYLLLEDWLRH